MCAAFPFILAAGGSAWASQAEVVQASRARVQVQRLAKLHFQMRAGVQAPKAGQELERALPVLEAVFRDLTAGAAEGRSRQIADRARRKWEGYRDLVALPSRDSASIHLASEDLENTLSALVQAMESDSSEALAPFVVLSLRQAMLSQRIAKLYLLRSLGDRSRGTEVDIAQTRLEFRAALGQLVNAPENTQRTRADLELARVQWIFFDNALEDGSNASPAYRLNVATTSERITQVMDDVVSELVPPVTATQPRKRKAATELSRPSPVGGSM
jgi:hypothetical protein